MRPLLGVLLASTLASTLALSACSSGESPVPEAAGSSAAPSSTPPSSKPTPTPKPKPDPPPQAGDCYLFGYQSALAPTRTQRASPCTKPHTAVTFFVGRFDKGLRVDGRQVHKVESTVCPHRFASFVGGTLEDRRLSLLRTVWFTPSVQQAALGARWFQCVAIALRGNEQLAALQVPVEGVLDSDSTRSHYALCATDQPGSSDFEQRLCSLPHSWRALRTVPFSPGPYPGDATVRSAGQTPCQDAARSVASDPLNFQWSYAWPTKAQWQAGQTYGVCWAPG
jgi:hypothetical protein